VRRQLIGAGLVVAMLAFGIGVYHLAAAFRGDHKVIQRPTAIAASPLPGTIYVVQGGALFRFQHGSFTQITSGAGWMQPAAAPNGQLVAVRRGPDYSDLYLLTSSGRPVAQLTHNSSPASVESNHWAFYPRVSPDGQAVFYAFDPKDPYNTYRVDLAIVASRFSSATRPIDWTVPNDFTGGDISPVPLSGGSLIYTRYSIDDNAQVHSQVWIQRRAGSPGLALTAPDLGCGQPAISPDEKSIAMVCNKGSNESAELDVASFDAASITLGPPTTLVSGRLVASPAFAPDGERIAFLAPSTPGGGFQLWTVNPSVASSVSDITTDLGLDSTSAPVWLAG